MILYVADKSLTDPYFGQTKLNKILFFSDFTSYQRQGQSVTGAVYQRLEWGPCAHQLLPVLGELKRTGAVVVKGEDTFAGTQRRVVALREADLSVFSATDIATLDEVLEHFRPLNNSQISELSHQTKAWRLTRNDQEIPYGMAQLASSGPTDEDLAWLKEVATSGAGVGPS